MANAAVRAGRSPDPTAARAPGRRGLDLKTTPGRLRLLLIGLVVLSLGWGALAAFTAVQYSSAASSVVTTREPLSLGAQRIYSRLSDANDAVTTAFLTVGPEPADLMRRYRSDIAAAGTAIQNATADGGTGAVARDLATLATQLPTYTQDIGTAEANNTLGLPLGAAYLREASNLMNGTLLPKAKDLYAAENASLGAADAQATGLPLIVVALVIGLAVGYALYRASRWLRGRTNRVLNVGLVAAGLALAVSLAWLAAAYLGGRSDLLNAQARGSATVEAVARAGIVAQQAHADESLTLIDNTGDDSYQANYLAQARALGPGPGTLLTSAATTAKGTPAAPALTAALGEARAWYAAHARLRSLDDSGQHQAAVASALGTAPGTAGASFTLLYSDLTTAITRDQAVFDATSGSTAGAYAGLEAGVIVAALLMAAGCAWGLSRRLAEYR